MDTNLSKITQVASSREDAWIETGKWNSEEQITESRPPARTRGLKLDYKKRLRTAESRVLPRVRVD